MSYHEICLIPDFFNDCSKGFSFFSFNRFLCFLLSEDWSEHAMPDFSQEAHLRRHRLCVCSSCAVFHHWRFSFWISLVASEKNARRNYLYKTSRQGVQPNWSILCYFECCNHKKVLKFERNWVTQSAGGENQQRQMSNFRPKYVHKRFMWWLTHISNKCWHVKQILGNENEQVTGWIGLTAILALTVAVCNDGRPSKFEFKRFREEKNWSDFTPTRFWVKFHPNCAWSFFSLIRKV